ncbi:MAG: M56 family metallopeptidase, partial [Planctomycetota bacterium]|nr:M56 family metallopeptidase [Planctomycetota bacterium]
NVGTAPAVSWKQRAAQQLESALPYVVSGWLLGVFALSVWHLGGWTQLQRLRRTMVKPVDASLRAKLDELAERLGVKRAVQLTESALVQIPTVVGWLRPIILLPASALTGLTAEQLEAILAHELAHIRRHDYLVNILQTIVETLGFYHPAVWWVSHKIRAERENCCDDLAVSVSGDRLGYARALTSMEEIRTARSKLAVAVGGGNLLRRICRLLGKDSPDTNRASWIPSVIAILLIAIIAIPTTLALTESANRKSGMQIELDGKMVGLEEILAKYEKHRDSAPKRYALVVRREHKIDVTYQNGPRVFSAQYLFGPPSGKPYDGQAAGKDKSSAGESMESALTWASEKPPQFVGVYDGEYSCSWWRDDDLGGRLRSRGKTKGGSDSFSHKTLQNLGWPQIGCRSFLSQLGHPNFKVRLVPDDKYAQDNGLVCIEEERKQIDSKGKVTDTVRTTRYYLNPARDFGCQRRDELHYKYTEKVTKYRQTEDGRWYPSEVTETGDRGIEQEVTLWQRLKRSVHPKRPGTAPRKQTIKIHLNNDPEFPAGVFDVDAMAQKVRREQEAAMAGDELAAHNGTERSALANEDKPHIRVDCRVLEIYPSMKLDRETTIVAENLLGEGEVVLVRIGKDFVPTHPGRTSRMSAPMFEDWIRMVAGTTVLGKEPSIVTADGQTTRKMVDLLVSRGYMKILMNPTIEVMDGGKGRVQSKRKVPIGKATAPSTQSDHYVDIIDYFEITPHILDDGGIKLLTEGTINRRLSRQDKGQPPIFTKSSFSGNVVVGRGMSLMIGGTQKTDGATEDSEEPQTKVLFIFTPTIVDTDEQQDKIEDETAKEHQQEQEPSAEGATPVRVGCFVLEIPYYPHADKDIADEARTILGDKISVSPIGIGPSNYVASLLEGVIEATRPVEENRGRDIRVTLDELEALVRMLAAKGYVRILFEPTISVADGQTAELKTDRESFQVTANIRDNGDIMLQSHIALGSESMPKSRERKPIVTGRTLDSTFLLRSGTAAIIGGTGMQGIVTGHNGNKPTTETMFIITATTGGTTSDQDRQHNGDNQTDREQEKPKVEIEAPRTEEQTGKIVYPKNWREITGEQPRLPEDPIAQYREDAQVHKRLEKIVDLPGLLG